MLIKIVLKFRGLFCETFWVWWNKCFLFLSSGIENFTFEMLLLIILKKSSSVLSTVSSNRSRSSHPEVFQGKDVLKICSKFTSEHPCHSAISIKLLCNFMEITFRHGCSPANLLHAFRTPFLKKTYGWLFLNLHQFWVQFHLIDIDLCCLISKLIWAFGHFRHFI